MGLPVLILGFSGSGKSSSMREFKPDELALVNVNGKFLPFRGKFAETLNSDDFEKIKNFMRSAKAKAIVVDDSQYLMLNEFMRRSKEKGYDKFTEIAEHFWSLIRYIEQLPQDTIVYFLHHVESGEDGRLKAKTVGKLLDEKVNIEGMFSIVLRTSVSENGYQFLTQTDGNDCCKSPAGMFAAYAVPNNLKMVDENIRVFYGLVPEPHCDECGAAFKPTPTRTANELAAASTAKFGRVLCAACARAEIARKQDVCAVAPKGGTTPPTEGNRKEAENAAATVSE